MPKKSPNDLTKRQAEVLRDIIASTKLRGVTPTRREASAILGISLNAAVGHLEALARKGYIDWIPRLARSMRILKGPPDSAPPGGTATKPARGTGAGRRRRSISNA